MAPVRVRVTVRERFEAGSGRERRSAPITAVAEAELAPLGGRGVDGVRGRWRLQRGRWRTVRASRCGPTCAGVRPHGGRGARGRRRAADQHGFRSDAEQAILFARHPDPKWVARPGTSLHRNGTELDLGPPAAYGWLAANARRFHFTQRYSWETWHYETP